MDSLDLFVKGQDSNAFFINLYRIQDAQKTEVQASSLRQLVDVLRPVSFDITGCWSNLVDVKWNTRVGMKYITIKLRRSEQKTSKQARVLQLVSSRTTLSELKQISSDVLLLGFPAAPEADWKNIQAFSDRNKRFFVPCDENGQDAVNQLVRNLYQKADTNNHSDEDVDRDWFLTPSSDSAAETNESHVVVHLS